MATNDPNYVLNYFSWDAAKINQQIKEWATAYLRPALINTGRILPLNESDQDQWLALQELSDEQDAKILGGRSRVSELEPNKHALAVVPNAPEAYNFPRYQKEELPNGCTALWHHRDVVPKVDIILECAAKYYDDPVDKQGLNDFVFDLLLEGTKQLDATAFAQAVESRGMSLETRPGHIIMSMFSEDLPFGLELLNQMVTDAAFDSESIERVREQIVADIRSYWDDPLEYVEQRSREAIYGAHPYSKNPQGTLKTVRSITEGDLRNAYKKYLTPQGARLSIVGDLSAYDVPKLVAKTLNSWSGSAFERASFPPLDPISKKTVNYPVHRDQIVLGFAGLSVARTDAAYEPLLIFDQYFTGGLEGSMSSRLFLLREQTGLFYTISGSLVMGAAEQPGMIYVRTLVSQENVALFKKIMNGLLENASKEISQEAFELAKNNIVSGLVDHFESGIEIAQAFLFLEKYKLPQDYFSTLNARMQGITLEQTKKIVDQYLDVNKLVTIQIGRI